MPRKVITVLFILPAIALIAGCVAKESGNLPSADSTVRSGSLGANVSDSAVPTLTNDVNVLQGTEWIVRDISRTPALDSTRATLQFSADGKVSGNTTCNGYSGNYTVTGGQIAVVQVVSTKRACVQPARMDQERRFIEVLQQSTTWSIGADTTLMLTSPSGGTITARR